MKKVFSSLEVICTKIVFFIAAALFGCLTYWAQKYTHEYGLEMTEEKVLGVYDSLKLNLLVLAGILVVLYIFQKLLLWGSLEQQRKKVFYFVIADMVLVGIFAIVWVTGSHITPQTDQLQVYLTTVEFRQGIYRDMEAYFYMFPQQYGIAFLYECVLWIWESYHLIQYVNVIFLLMTVFFSYKLSEVLFESPRVSFYTVLVLNAFLPLTIYVNFVYGELCTVATCICSIWAVLCWMKTEKKRYIVAASVSMTFALLVRMNMVIVAIALTIILVIFAMRNRKWKALLVAALLFAVPMGSIQAVEWSYEMRSGLEVGDGIPAVAWVAMGMQQSWQGAGVYNAYNNSTFWQYGGDTEKTAEVSWAYIKERIQEFKNDLPGARYFYQSKIWEQWNVGSFSSLFMTNHFDAAPFPLAQELYGGTLKEPVVKWMNYYLFALYAGALVYSVYGLFFEKEFRKTLLPMVVIGGMIFSLLWEAKPRYVFPYVVILLPSVAMGFHICHRGLEELGIRIKGKVKWTK